MKIVNKINEHNIYWVEKTKRKREGQEMSVVELNIKKASIFSFKGIKMLFKIFIVNHIRKNPFGIAYFEEKQ